MCCEGGPVCSVQLGRKSQRGGSADCAVALLISWLLHPRHCKLASKLISAPQFVPLA